MHFVDFLILGAYFLGMLGVGLYFQRRQEGLDEYFVSGRSLPWWLAGVSMVATGFAIDTPLGITGLVAANGVKGVWYAWAAIMGGAGVFGAFIFAALMRRSRVVTLAELIELRYSGAQARYLRILKAVYIGILANAITLGWVMSTSHEPPMMAFSVGVQRYSLGVLREANECVIAYPSELQTKETLLFGTKSGRDTDKLELSGVSTSPAKVIDCVLMDDAVANFECKLTGEFETGDHVIFAGEIVADHVNPDAPGRLYTVGKGYKMGGLSIRT